VSADVAAHVGIRTGGAYGAVYVPVDQTIALGPALRSPVAFGPMVSQPGTIVPPIVARLLHRSDPTVSVTVFDQAHSVRWLDNLNEPGSGSLILQNDDPDLALIQDGDLIRFEHYGYAAMAIVVQDDTRVTLADGEEHDEITTISGAGHMAVLETSRIYPARGVGALPAEQDRLFSWQSVDYDDSAWATATTMAVTNAIPEGNFGWWLFILAENKWPDLSSEWIWAAGYNAEDSSPAGTCYFRKTFYWTDATRIRVHAAADNRGGIYLDGQPVITGMDDLGKVFTADLYITAGLHTIAAYAENVSALGGLFGPDVGPAGLNVTVWTLDEHNVVGDLIVHTDSTWKIVEYPPAPLGMTPTMALRLVVDEAHARGELTGVSLRFTDDTDSNGEPVPIVAGISTKVGTDVLAFARELVTYLDIWMAPSGLELWAWNSGQRGRPSGVTLTRGVNLAALTQQRVTSPINALLVRWHGGWHEVTDPSSIARYGRRGGMLGLGAAQTIAEVEAIGRQQLAIYADVREVISVDLVPADESDRPYPAFLVGDTVTVPNVDGDPTVERVMALTVSQDDDGQVTYAPELHDLILSAQERYEQALKKMEDGTMSGTSQVASPVSQVVAPLGVPSPEPPELRPSWLHLHGTQALGANVRTGVGTTYGDVEWRQSPGADMYLTATRENLYDLNIPDWPTSPGTSVRVTTSCEVLLEMSWLVAYDSEGATVPTVYVGLYIDGGPTGGGERWTVDHALLATPPASYVDQAYADQWLVDWPTDPTAIQRHWRRGSTSTHLLARSGMVINPWALTPDVEAQLDWNLTITILEMGTDRAAPPGPGG
jgi:hypothetical protein